VESPETSNLPLRKGKAMKVLVCGSRYWTDYAMIHDRLSTLPLGTTIIQGMAPGADSCARLAAIRLGFKYEDYPAKWSKYGKGAGPIRNQQMIEQKPDLVIAFHEDFEKSKGTNDMLERAVDAIILWELINAEGEVTLDG